VLKFFLSAFIFLCILAVQYFLEILNSYANSLKFQEFVDLCSVSNISVLIMDQHFHGFYIHGKAPWGRSDLTMSELKAELDAEGDGSKRARGIVQDPNKLRNMSLVRGEIQTYEIYFPAQLREEYDNLYN
jgi:meckelin